MRALLLATVAVFAATPSFAQDSAETDAQLMQGDIIVTATKRSQSLADVPIAVSAVTAQSLQNSGATDIRQLNQLSPSLLVSSTSSEAGAGVARIRGIGTVGDNPGLESSVAVFIDGVYRSRSGVGLTELGEVDRIEVLRGPQGTLFGRNASAGLINIVTKRPSFEVGGNAELSYGNFNYWRISGGITGGLIDSKLAARLDGVYTKRDGFLEDVISGRTVNDRDRYLFRGQLLFTPNDDVELRIIGDFAKREEECCATSYLPFRSSVRDAQGNVTVISANPIVNIIRELGGVINDDTYARKTSITPGQSYRSNVTDWGLSGELIWNLGGAELTSITAYRDWKVSQSQDADFMNLDVLRRENQTRQFQTFSQELRLQGSAFSDRLDWLVGGYFANEKLFHTDQLRFGQDHTRYANCLIANSFNASAPGILSPSSPGCVDPAIAAAIAGNPAIPAALRTPVSIFGGFAVPGLYGYDAVGALLGLPPGSLEGRGIGLDTYDQTSRNFAFFTHNVLNLTDRLSLTLGGRYTNERKTLDVDLNGTNTFCAAIVPSPLAGLAAPVCAINGIASVSGTTELNEERFTGTAVLSFKATEDLLTYASFSRGYKAGGFNLDRSALVQTNVNLESLRFAPELVDSVEVGAKLALRDFRFNIAAFHAVFDQFQLNTFNGTNFIVENISACNSPLNANGTCSSDDLRGGVTSSGVELEATVFPAPNFSANLGLTYAETKYRDRLTGTNGNAIPAPLFAIPGQQLSNAPSTVVTGAFTWTPPVTDTLGALFYIDWRYQSEMNSGSDLFTEKRQADYVVVNARIGLNGNERRWSIEGWVQNLFDTEFQQVAINTPLQGGGTIADTVRGGPNATTLFSSFLGEPRTFGVTVRTRF